MLGDLIYEAKSKVRGIRVLDVEGGIPKIEVNIIQNGTLKGRTEATNIVTYWNIPQSGEAYYVEGKGVFMAKDDRRTSSTTGNKLAFLDNIVGVFEYEADEMGNSEGKVWEWK
jgi:hypothetical protein